LKCVVYPLINKHAALIMSKEQRCVGVRIICQNGATCLPYYQ
jgi:hypothetical protein